MCRNIKTLFNFEPPATETEIRASALQFVRKSSGFNKPSKANEDAFNRAIVEVTSAASRLDLFARNDGRAPQSRARGREGQGARRDALRSSRRRCARDTRRRTLFLAASEIESDAVAGSSMIGRLYASRCAIALCCLAAGGCAAVRSPPAEAPSAAAEPPQAVAPAPVNSGQTAAPARSRAVTGAGSAISASAIRTSTAGVRAGRPSVAAAPGCRARAEPLGVRQHTAGRDSAEHAAGPATGRSASAGCRVEAARRRHSGASNPATARRAESGSGGVATRRSDARFHVPRHATSRDQGDRRAH